MEKSSWRRIYTVFLIFKCASNVVKRKFIIFSKNMGF